MRKIQKPRALALALVCIVPLSLTAFAADVNVMLNGEQEVPPVSTPARGTGVFKFDADGAVSGKVTTTGISGTAAHIHEAPAGEAGGVIIPLVKDSDNTWAVPAGTKLSQAQEAAYKAGDLYVNVHSDAHKDGEIRGQIRP
jgi:CHRD domain